MADNYLEKKMEEYLCGKNKTTTAKRYSSIPKPGTINIKFPSRRVFVTGGASGIGRAIVETFRKSNCKVAFCDIDSKAGALTAQATGAQFHPVDVTDAAALQSCMQHIFTAWGDIDIIVNNVGIGKFMPLTDCTLEDFDLVLATNLRPVFITARQLALHRRSLAESNDYGRIINICSTRHSMSEAGTEAYSASKGGIDALTHALMASLAPMHITVNAISPGWIETKCYNNLSEEDHNQHPSLRVGTPDDIAKACIYLSLPENDFLNGQNIVIDGGMTKKMIYI